MLCQFLLCSKVTELYIDIHFLPDTSFHHALSQETGLSSPCCAEGSHGSSILNVIVCIYQPQTPRPSHPATPGSRQPRVCSPRLCLTLILQGLWSRMSHSVSTHPRGLWNWPPLECIPPTPRGRKALWIKLNNGGLSSNHRKIKSITLICSFFARLAFSRVCIYLAFCTCRGLNLWQVLTDDRIMKKYVIKINRKPQASWDISPWASQVFHHCRCSYLFY